MVDHYFFIIIICMKKLSAPDWLKTSASSCNTNEDCIVCRVSVMFFHAHHYQVITCFILQFGVIGTCTFFKDYKLQLLYGLVQFCCLYKI